MTEPVNINAVPKLNLGLQETDEVFVSRGGSGPYRVPASSFPWQQKGDPGAPGGSWTPVLSLVTDGVRRVHRIVGWVGGTGVEPTTTGYIGAAGIVSNVAEAVDVRGLQGNAGWAPVLALVADGDRRVHQVIDWTGGAGAKPGVGWYVGATGLVELIQDAVNVRGATGGVGWSPVLAVVPDGNRRVQQIVDWIGGAGTKPTALGYVSTSGIVATAALAADVSGAQGNAGWAPVLAIVADGERRVQQVVDWVGGAGTKPATLGYVGTEGIVAAAVAAVDVRGVKGAQGLAGNPGWAPVLAILEDGERLVQKVVDWTGGLGTKPEVLGYIGSTGIVATAAAAVNVRGSTYWFVGSWAGLMAATAADSALASPMLASGYRVALVTDIEGRGLEVMWTGLRWKPRSGSYTLAALRAPWMGIIGTNEQKVIDPIRIPANFLCIGDILDVWLSSYKPVAGIESITTRIRIGAAGGAPDPALISYAITGSTQIQRRYLFQVVGNAIIRPITNSGVDAILTGATEAIVGGSYASGAALPADIAMGAGIDTEQYLSISNQMSGMTQAPRMLGAFVRVF